jgi:hypothetical protein
VIYKFKNGKSAWIDEDSSDEIFVKSFQPVFILSIATHHEYSVTRFDFILLANLVRYYSYLTNREFLEINRLREEMSVSPRETAGMQIGKT